MSYSRIPLPLELPVDKCQFCGENPAQVKIGVNGVKADYCRDCFVLEWWAAAVIAIQPAPFVVEMQTVTVVGGK